MSTCPVVPSFLAIRTGPATGKRAAPARRAMPKSRQASKTTSTPNPAKDSLAKPNLSVSVPPLSSSRDDGPEEGEISDDEDDHYSPREATTPVHQMPSANPFDTAVLAASMQAPLISPFFNNVNSKQKQEILIREQHSINTLQNIQDNPLMPMPELRKAAQSAVMYLACSAKMSFEDIVAEGVDSRVLASFFNQLKLPNSFPKALDSSKNVPTTVPPKSGAPELLNGFKPANTPTTNTQQFPTNTKKADVVVPTTLSSSFPSSLPPKPPIPLNNAPKNESVVSRFNQSIPGLNVTQLPSAGLISPPLPTPQADPLAQEVSPTSQPPTLRGRKRPVAADFDTEIKPSPANPKQPRFGNRQHLEASHLIFDVSDNEEDDKEHRGPTQGNLPSRPNSTKPEVNENLGESLRQKELQIELMRQRIMLASRKKKNPGNGEAGSGASTKPSTPLPLPPSNDLLAAKEARLENVEEFIHQTLDDLNAGIAKPANVEAAVELADNELMEIESKTQNMNIENIAKTHSTSQLLPTPVPENTEVKDTDGTTLDSESTAVSIAEGIQTESSEKSQSDNKSFATAPIDLDDQNDTFSDALGSPMELSDLTSSDQSDLEADSDSKSSPNANDTISDGSSDGVSSDDSDDDIEMEESSGDISPVTDSASSPAFEEPGDDGYDPEDRKPNIGEVSQLPGNTEAIPTQPSFATGVSEREPVRPIPIGLGPNPKPRDTGYVPYQSQLAGFRSFRYHPSYNQMVSQGYKSLTYSNRIDSQLPVCQFEARGGNCNDPLCRWQHFRQMALPEDKILQELAEPDASQANKEEYKSALNQTTSQLDNFEKMAEEIVEYRRQQLGDPTRIIKGI